MVRSRVRVLLSKATIRSGEAARRFNDDRRFRVPVSEKSDRLVRRRAPSCLFFRQVDESRIHDVSYSRIPQSSVSSSTPSTRLAKFRPEEAAASAPNQSSDDSNLGKENGGRHR